MIGSFKSPCLLGPKSFPTKSICFTRAARSSTVLCRRNSEVLHAEMMRVEVGGTQQPPVGEAPMKSESDTNAADEDENKWSFLRRLNVAMAAERLKKADEVVKPRPPARRDDSH